jgi:hypothetical protein
MIKRFAVLTVVAGSFLAAAASAGADQPLLVTGAGASATSGHVVVHARATGPATGTGIPVAPADGFLRTRGSSAGDLTGSVTCIGVLFPGRAIVSGTLDTPVVSGGFTFPHFSLIVGDGGEGDSWIALFVTNLAGLGGVDSCGTSLFFSAGLLEPETFPQLVVSRGDFQILGDS